MLDIEKALNSIRKKRAVILGVGNALRGDDGLGPELVKRLEGRVAAILMDCGNVPENGLFRIIKHDPEALVVIDAADFGKEPGHIGLINETDIEGASFSTHSLPLKLAIKFLKAEIPHIQVLFIGVQPANRDFSSPISETAGKAINRLETLFSRTFKPE